MINLSSLELKIFTQQDAEDYCQINSINHKDITELSLNNNSVTGIKLLKYYDCIITELKIYVFKIFLKEIRSDKNLKDYNINMYIIIKLLKGNKNILL